MHPTVQLESGPKTCLGHKNQSRCRTPRLLGTALEEFHFQNAIQTCFVAEVDWLQAATREEQPLAFLCMRIDKCSRPSLQRQDLRVY